MNDKRISEVAAVSMPHAIKGQCICVYVVTKNGYIYDDEVEKDLRNLSTYHSYSFFEIHPPLPKWLNFNF